MTQKKLYLVVLLTAMVSLLFSGIGYAADTEKEPGSKNKTGYTRFQQAGDEIVFRVIPAGQEQPIDAYYYERMTDKTVVTPKGQTVRLNSLGDVGKDPSIYFAFLQEDDGTINFYGAVIPSPADPSTYVYSEWVTEPDCGYAINYPGKYYVGAEWTQKFKTTNMFGVPVADVNVAYKVEAFEKITIADKKYKAFKIIARNADGSINNISWFSPDLGVNIKKLSFDPSRPGYEFVSASFDKK